MKPSMLRQEMKSPTAVPAALIKTTVANKTAAKEAAHRVLPGTHRHDGREQD
jgi:hypothetical protein